MKARANDLAIDVFRAFFSFLERLRCVFVCRSSPLCVCVCHRCECVNQGGEPKRELCVAFWLRCVCMCVCLKVSV